MYKVGDLIILKSKEILIKENFPPTLLKEIAGYGFPFGETVRITNVSYQTDISIEGYPYSFDPRPRVHTGYKNMKEKRAMGLAV